jgi:hypothetical protein
MSLFPVNFLRYFSNEVSVENGKSTWHQLTQSSAFHFLRRDRKDR